MHHTIVPLQDRLDEAHRRNVLRRRAADVDDSEIERIDAAIFELEAELFDPIGLDADAVTAEFIDAYDPETGR